MLEDPERRYVERAPIGRLATADAEGQPHVVPVCFAVVGDDLVTPIDEKPKRVGPESLRRSRDIHENPYVALLVDHYTPDWARLGWVQVRGTAAVCSPTAPIHPAAVTALRRKYDQYASHDLDARPIIRVEPTAVRSWGRLERP